MIDGCWYDRLTKINNERKFLEYYLSKQLNNFIISNSYLLL